MEAFLLEKQDLRVQFLILITRPLPNTEDGSFVVSLHTALTLLCWLIRSDNKQSLLEEGETERQKENHLTDFADNNQII